jgi:hypothetical protein
MGLHLGRERTGYLAVGARADLTLFDVDVEVGPEAHTLETLARFGEGRAAGTIVKGEVRHLSKEFS